MTSDKHQKALFAALLKVLRPLARFLLRNGVSYTAFKDLAKQAFVDVATKEFALPGKKQTVSRVATITGLTRKEIKRLQDLPDSGHDRDLVNRYNRAARVVYGWVHDPKYSDADENATVLPFEGGEGPTFTSLVKTYSGDVPPRAILDELTQVGVVEASDENNIRLLERAYIPTKGETEKMVLFGRDIAGLIATMDNNIHKVGKPVFQRKVFYDNMPADAVEELQILLNDKGQAFLEFMDKWMAARDRDANPEVKGSGRKAAGIGLYYFEEDLPEEP